MSDAQKVLAFRQIIRLYGKNSTLCSRIADMLVDRLEAAGVTEDDFDRLAHLI